MNSIYMERQYIFFNTGKALTAFFIGLICLFVIAGYLALSGISNPYLAVLILILCSRVIIWISFQLDKK
jgi:hypothetical protein